jgi:hypothetical protein
LLHKEKDDSKDAKTRYHISVQFCQPSLRNAHVAPRAHLTVSTITNSQHLPLRVRRALYSVYMRAMKAQDALAIAAAPIVLVCFDTRTSTIHCGRTSEYEVKMGQQFGGEPFASSCERPPRTHAHHVPRMVSHPVVLFGETQFGPA